MLISENLCSYHLDHGIHYKLWRIASSTFGSWVGRKAIYYYYKKAYPIPLLCSAAESGYIPGMLYQMSRMYKPGELSSRIGILICMACIAGIVSGPIAYGTSFLEGRNKLHGWQYLFILEGVPTIVLSIVSYFSLFDTVDQVSWLTSEQKALQHKRMMDQEQGDGSSSKIGWGTIYKAFADWKTWLFAVVYMTNAVNFYSFAIFSPMLIDGNMWGNFSSRIED